MISPVFLSVFFDFPPAFFLLDMSPEIFFPLAFRFVIHKYLNNGSIAPYDFSCYHEPVK